MKTRTDLINNLMWNTGGVGFGICSVGNSMMWGMNRPSKENDLKSVVAISGNQENYTDEELEKLVEFSRQRTEEYDKMFKVRMGANLICIEKMVGKIYKGGVVWLRKRLSWEMGPMYSETLDEALIVFKR